ncbi:RNA pyrophosphohydrolase [Azospirillum brasilense]|uniref:RNA pyrophosphohydrolase n=1 Tax=Azospirillum brasilense TaxID=192 RepID=UPI000E6A9378|nr:RNA pyrophosphohydrolase [Azospirillum brasilense]NUB24506.1 RNA pyrophosphohydrolase [Azospirillum brasilense]NUB32404.1 RNA pyrophosphohydrolase [Azospirillum brasilense]RIV99553.1 RNA pyrophosphohydrolase [Azospirillum brasilense]
MSKKPIDRESLPYRPCVGVMLLNDRGQVFVARRCDSKDAWQMPQGGIDEGEGVHEAALRELKEEIGTDKAEILGETAEKLRYDLPDHLLGKVWKGRWRGQEQVWLAARFTGADSDIDLATEHPEFDAWTWVDADDLPGLIVPFKRPVYESVLAEFASVIATLRRG